MFPRKEKLAEFICFHSQKRMTLIDNAQQSKKNETFSTLVRYLVVSRRSCLTQCRAVTKLSTVGRGQELDG